MKFNFSFLSLLATLSLRDFIVQSFEYETTEFTSAVFNYSYTKDNKRYIAATEAIDFYRGKFGSLNPRELQILPLAGHIYTPYKDFDGCSYENIDDSHILDGPDFNNVVVVVSKGGQCSLWDKIVEAAHNNFSALIEYDTDSDHSMEDLKDYDPDKVDFGPSEIVYALATKPAGKYFEALYLNGTHPHISIAAGPTTIMRLAISRTSVLFVAVSFIVLTLISLVWLVFYYIQRFRFLHNRDRTKKRLAAAAKKALTILQVRTLKKGDNELDSDEMCSICIEDFVTGDVVRELPCTHKFHKTCVDPWLISKYTCPNCKINVLKSLQLVDGYELQPEESEPEGTAENNAGGPTTHSTETRRRSMRAGPSAIEPSAPPFAVVMLDNYPSASCSNSNANAQVVYKNETVQSPDQVFLVVPTKNVAENSRQQQEEPEMQIKCSVNAPAEDKKDTFTKSQGNKDGSVSSSAIEAAGSSGGAETESQTVEPASSDEVSGAQDSIQVEKTHIEAHTVIKE